MFKFVIKKTNSCKWYSHVGRGEYLIIIKYENGLIDYLYYQNYVNAKNAIKQLLSNEDLVTQFQRNCSNYRNKEALYGHFFKFFDEKFKDLRF